MFGLSRSQSEFIANKISTDDSYDIVRTYQQTTSERSKYDFLFELAYPFLCACMLSLAITSVATIQVRMFSFGLLAVSFLFSASGLYLVIFIMHTTKEVSFSESEKYKQIAKQSREGQSVQASQAQVKTVRLEIGENDNGYRHFRYVDFPDIDDGQLLQIAVHCLKNGNSFSRSSLSSVISERQYPALLQTFENAGMVREVDGRGTKELTPSGKSILGKYIEAV